MTTNLENLSATLVSVLTAFEAGMRKLHPLAIPAIRGELAVHEPVLAAVRASLVTEDGNAGPEDGRRELMRACDFLLQAVRNFGREEDLQDAFFSALRASRKTYRAQEALFPLCRLFPAVDRYFLEPGAEVPPEMATGDSVTGLFHIGANRDLHTRGGYSLYIPPAPFGEHARSLVVALHGGYGHGRDFIWTWIREARSRGFVLCAPTAQAMTWSIGRVETDAQMLLRHLEEVCTRVSIDRNRILLTGMSDGGTFALALGLTQENIFSKIAAVSCALPPVKINRAEEKHVLWIHGAQDWIFPVQRTVQACRYLQQSGVDIKLKVIPDLSHAYPCEENDTILKWFGIEG
ncbi:MAG TPA: dienelactone hydrolase family protein [Smithellaceae bacterium]|nr:dienelactone hydrolase family protein [Smithellaceae bacterium]HRS83113.1 dienelactone hydrolase family protein [Smithellaceae bacterium]HRV45751.1 dienelactone hydrolase family protein [Smithellaceae bacterium]